MSRAKVFLWESQREYVRLLADLQATHSEIAAIFGCSDTTVRDTASGQKATTKMRDLSLGLRRHPVMSKAEYEAIVVLAERQLRQHPSLVAPFDRLCRLLAVTYEEHEPDTVTSVHDSSFAADIERIADTYIALGEQLVKIVDLVRHERDLAIEMHVRTVLGETLQPLVADAVEAYFA